MDQIEDPQEPDESRREPARFVGDQTTYQSLKQFVEELSNSGSAARRRDDQKERSGCARELWEVSGCPPDRGLGILVEGRRGIEGSRDA